MMNKKIILIAGKGQSTNIIFNALYERYGVVSAIIEDNESPIAFWKRRLKKLGLVKVLGQIGFQLLIQRPLKLCSKYRIDEIIRQNKLNQNDIPNDKIQKVNSINSKITIELLKSLNPDLIIVNGTRIISKRVLQSVPCKFVNIHAGITPMYRGVHGTYWALVNNDFINSGVTVHFVDEGIDTGQIIAQKQVRITSKDNFSTYPLLQLSVGLELLFESIDSCFKKSTTSVKVEGESKLYYHPTIWAYLFNRIFKKVK